MNDQLYFTHPHAAPGYRDLRPWQDDRSVLTNPHKGWYFHFADNGLRFPRYRDTIRPGDDLRSVPGINHLYLRFDWSDIEEMEGVFRWDKIDAILNEWGAKGYRFSMRLCTYEANRPMITHATPKWVFDQGAKSYRRYYEAPPWILDAGLGEPGKQYYCVEPDYGDPVYLEKLEKLMEAYGKKYNGHPLIDFVDVGTFGTWGEGHTSTGSCKTYPFSVLKRHVDMHLHNFPDTFVLINDDMIKHAGQTSEADAQRLAAYCAGHVMGMRDDSLYVSSYCKQYGCDMLAIPTAFELFWRRGPVDLESGHQAHVQADGVMEGGFRLLEAMRRTHATYAGFHGDAYAWYARHAGFHDYAANRLGYWYFVEGYSLPELAQGLNARLTLYISNRGFAPAYHRYALRVIARAEGGEETLLNENGVDNRRWMCGETAEECLLLKTAALNPGRYQLGLGLFHGDRPVLLGMKAERRMPGGHYLLGEIEIQ